MQTLANLAYVVNSTAKVNAALRAHINAMKKENARLKNLANRIKAANALKAFRVQGTLSGMKRKKPGH